MQTAFANAKVMRSLGGRYVSSAFNNRAQIGEAPDAITQGIDVARTVYDPAITETTPFYGRRVRLGGLRRPVEHQPVLSEERPPAERAPDISDHRLLPPGLRAGHQHVQHAVDQDHGPGRSVQRQQQHHLRLEQQPHAADRQGLERQLPSCSFNQPLLAGAGAAVQPHRRSLQPVQRAAGSGLCSI